MSGLAPAEKRLIDILAERQAAAGLPDTQFAATLRITQSHWWRLKRYQRGVGKRLAQRILGRYPDLWPEVQQAVLVPSPALRV